MTRFFLVLLFCGQTILSPSQAIAAPETVAAPEAPVAVLIDVCGAALSIDEALLGPSSIHGFRLTTLDERARGGWRSTCAAPLGEVERLIDDGNNHFLELRFEQAKASLGRAVALLERMNWVAAPTSAPEAWVRLGWIESQTGNAAGMAEMCRRAIQLWPSYQPDPLRFPPDIIVAYATQRAELLKSATATVHVDAPAEGLAVALNGVFACRAPCTIGSLPAGEYTLAVSGGGGAAYFQTVHIGANDERRLLLPRCAAAALADAAAASAGAWASVKRTPAACGAEAAVLFFARPVGDAATSAVALDNTGKVEHGGPGPSGEIARVLLDRLRQTRQGDAPLPEPITADVSFLDRPWFLPAVLIGAAAVVGGGLAIILSTREDRMQVFVHP